PPPTPTLFPYTTLFRSGEDLLDGPRGAHRVLAEHRTQRDHLRGGRDGAGVHPVEHLHRLEDVGELLLEARLLVFVQPKPGQVGRSEEHTSELQSLAYLV